MGHREQAEEFQDMSLYLIGLLCIYPVIRSNQEKTHPFDVKQFCIVTQLPLGLRK